MWETTGGKADEEGELGMTIRRAIFANTAPASAENQKARAECKKA